MRMVHGAEFIAIVVPVLIGIAMLTLIERKVMGSMQRRLGPNTSGIFGLAQPIADGLKLFVKQFIVPNESFSIVFIIAPIISLTISLFIWCILPLQPGYAIYQPDHSILFALALSSLAVYGILLSGWSGNSKYSVLGSIRSSAQMISYELSITLLLLSVILSDGFSFSDLLQSQSDIWNIFLYWPAALLYGISVLAETNRAPFDLPEAESELVSGFNTEYSSLPFAFFFLAEYGFMISQSLIFVIIFLGGPFLPFIDLPEFLYPFVTIIKVAFILFIFVAIRATLPRFRYDLLQDLAWNSILPLSLLYLFTLIVLLLV